MSFSAFHFPVYLGLLLTVLGGMQAVGKRWKIVPRLQLVLLLAASYGFVAVADWRFCGCLIIVSAFVYFIAILIDRCVFRRTCLVGGIICLVVVLGYFKYCNFFLESFTQLFHRPCITQEIILPLGISFYVFSALSYLIDVYRRDYPAERNALTLGLYIAFFPKLLAGPIVRGKDFFPQVQHYRGLDCNAFLTGLQIFVFGLFKKIVLADHLGVFVDDVFYAPRAYSGGTMLLAVVSYSLQIYFDFSGYSDMAIGTARLLGFDFRPNFNLPYLSQNVSEFWSRWHISLSTWFRDYLYIPLGGSRKGEIRTCFNLLVVMLVSGLWHGAGYTFLLWGALHGVLCCFHKCLGKQLARLGRLANGALTFVAVSLLWVVFRADGIATAGQVYRGLFTFQDGICQPYTWSFFAIAVVLGASVVAIQRSRRLGISERHGNPTVAGFYPILDLSRFWSKIAFFTFVGLTILLGYYGDTAFIYGAF